MGAARLVPRPDGYADYVEQPPTPPALPRGQGQHRYPGPRRTAPTVRPAARQRGIRSTIIILLIVPLLSLVALWVYAATSTVGGAIAERQADAVDRAVRIPTQNLIISVDTERADTFVWQSAQGHLPRTAMVAQRAKTAAAITAFKAGNAAALAAEVPEDRQLIDDVMGGLQAMPALWARIDAGEISALAAFQRYNTITNEISLYGTAFTNRAGTVALNQQAVALLQEGQAADAIGQQATLMAGAQIAGNRMAPDMLRAFVQTVDNQRLLETQGILPVNWVGATDPYLPVLNAPVYAELTKLQDTIIATPAGSVLPVGPTTWQDTVGAVIKAYTAAEVVAGGTVTAGDTHQSDITLLRLILVGGAGLLAVIASSLLLLRFGNRMSRELGGLRGAVRALAEERLPSVVSRLRAGAEVDIDTEAPPLNLGTRTKEVTDTAGAFSAVQRTAVEVAVEQAQLRKAFSMVFRSLARRNQSLLQRQLKMLDEMERATEEPQALEQLFRLDHLTTRMRRQAEGLIILSGAAPGRSWREPVPVIEVLRGALGEIEDFARVDLSADAPDFLQGTGVADVTHLLAELIENAVLYSPPSTRVQIRCGRVANGYAIEIEDRGLGIPEQAMNDLNERLARPQEFDLADSDQLGLFVVSRLAARQQIKVALRPSAYGGTLAVALLPPQLVVSEEQAVFLASAGPGGTRGGGGPAGGAPGNGPAGSGPAGGGPAGAGSTGVGGMRRPASLPAPENRSGSVATAPPPGISAGSASQSNPSSRPASQPNRMPTRQPQSQPQPQVQPQLQPQAQSAPVDLPRREPMANMAPQLRDNPRPAQPAGGVLAGRSPEQARALLSSIRQGFRSGLNDAGGDTDFPDQNADATGADEEWGGRHAGA